MASSEVVARQKDKDEGETRKKDSSSLSSASHGAENRQHPAPQKSESVGGRLLSGVVGVAEVLLMRRAVPSSGSSEKLPQANEEHSGQVAADGSAAGEAGGAHDHEGKANLAAYDDGRAKTVAVGVMSREAWDSGPHPASSLSFKDGDDGGVAFSAHEPRMYQAGGNAWNMTWLPVPAYGTQADSTYAHCNQIDGTYADVGAVRTGSLDAPAADSLPGSTLESPICSPRERRRAADASSREDTRERALPPVPQKSQLLGMVGSAVGVVEGIRASVPSLPSASMFTNWSGTAGKPPPPPPPQHAAAADQLQRLGDHNALLENEVGGSPSSPPRPPLTSRPFRV